MINTERLDWGWRLTATPCSAYPTLVLTAEVTLPNDSAQPSKVTFKTTGSPPAKSLTLSQMVAVQTGIASIIQAAKELAGDNKGRVARGARKRVLVKKKK